MREPDDGSKGIVDLLFLYLVVGVQGKLRFIIDTE